MGFFVCGMMGRFGNNKKGNDMGNDLEYQYYDKLEKGVFKLVDELREAEDEISSENKNTIKEIIQKTIDQSQNLVDMSYKEENEDFAHLEVVGELTQLIDFLQDFCLNPINEDEFEDAESEIPEAIRKAEGIIGIMDE